MAESDTNHHVLQKACFTLNSTDLLYPNQTPLYETFTTKRYFPGFKLV